MSLTFTDELIHRSTDWCGEKQLPADGIKVLNLIMGLEIIQVGIDALEVTRVLRVVTIETANPVLKSLIVNIKRILLIFLHMHK